MSQSHIRIPEQPVRCRIWLGWLCSGAIVLLLLGYWIARLEGCFQPELGWTVGQVSEKRIVVDNILEF